jgi:DNA recombination protein RmuC
MNAVIFLIVGLLVGFLVAYFINKKQLENIMNDFQEKEKRMQNQLADFDKEKSIIETKYKQILDGVEKTIHQLENEREISKSQSIKIATFENENKNLSEKLQSQKTEIEELQKRLTTEFENIANKILKERANEFSLVNEKNMGELLNPLKEKISSFEKKVEEAYDKEFRDKISLKEEVKRLADLNTRISEDANNLTKALKGDVKKQGNWGEIILERVLESSGLTQGKEYRREVHIEGDDKNQRPDVVIYLPDNKHIIIDSKVSLVAYEQYVNANTDEEKRTYLKKHVESLKNHVKLLSEKKYQALPNLNAPDFVLLFLPIESSFSVAVQESDEIFSYAWERKIVIVSPTTLLATLSTISSIWKQENQTKNAREIARLSGSLYDKFILFLDDLKKIKENINKAGNAYDEAMKKMQTGNGNVFVTAEKIKKLGAKAAKSLPENFIEHELPHESDDLEEDVE